MSFGSGVLARLRHWTSAVGEQRKPRRESRALAGAVAFSRDSAAVKFDKMTHDRKPESESAETTRRRTVSLSKTIEHARQKLRIDSLPGVFYGDFRLRSFLRD